jgi:hypothetical protein
LALPHIVLKSHINRKINVNDSEEIFVINEIYPNSMRGAVLNTFNIREILELFNLLYTGFFSEKKSLKLAII